MNQTFHGQLLKAKLDSIEQFELFESLKKEQPQFLREPSRYHTGA